MNSVIKSITIVTPNYPSPREIERGAFVERLVAEWQGNSTITNVIAPLPYFNRARLQLIFGQKSNAPIAGDNIHYPRFLSLTSNKFFSLDLNEISQNNFYSTVERCQKKISVPDVFYGKFLFTGGLSAIRLGNSYNRKSFVDLGESTLLERLNLLQRKVAKNLLNEVAGVVCVSPRLYDEVIQLGVKPSKILLSPNHADINRFFPRNKQECRKKLSLPKNDFIVIFVGHFIDRKGPLRVLDAINKVGGNVKGVFLGRGAQVPKGERVLFAEPVSNDVLPTWLNAADVMMLPTLAEGSCNAINEALACGLPIISSDIDDIKWQINNCESVRLVDPKDINALASALRDVLNRPLNSYLPITEQLVNKKRGIQIFNWMNSILADPSVQDN